jgi:hypothetical protein
LAQTLFTHATPALHLVPQDPQLAELVVRSVQTHCETPCIGHFFHPGFAQKLHFCVHPLK